MSRETKMAVPSADTRVAMADMLAAFEHFKQANDDRLEALESKTGADPLIADKVNRIDAALNEAQSRLDRLSREAARPDLSGADVKSAGWSGFLRTGETPALDQKALSGQTGAQGGHVAPAELETRIERLIREVSPIRSIATVKQTRSHTFKKPVSAGGATGAWAAETASRPETDASSLELLEFPTAELYAMPAATRRSWMMRWSISSNGWPKKCATSSPRPRARPSSPATGVNKPRGFLSYTMAEVGTESWGEMGFVSTGVSGGFSVSDPADALIDLIYAPKTAYRANGRFVMNRSTVSAVRKFKDADGQYIWQPAQSAGQSASLMGYPVTEAEDMPDIGANSYSIAFGDFERGYLVVDRQGVQVLRDPYSAKPYVLFYTTRRVGGGVQDFDAIKCLKFAA
jgi:predicted phage gp36 major capsid-like protein